MRSIIIYALDFVFLLPLIYEVESTVEKLKCYQCEVRDSAQCTDEYLLPCPDNQSYDRCILRVYKTKTDEEWIHKSCGLAPCTFRDKSQSTGLGLDNCDRSQNEYDCVSCCKESGCNTGGSNVCQPIILLILVAVGAQFCNFLRGKLCHFQ